MESCLSSHSNEKNIIPAKPAPSNLFIHPLSSAPFNFVHGALFFRHHLRPKPGFLLLTGASDAVREAQNSIVSNVDRFLKLVRSQNALLDRLLSFPSYLHNCCQIPRRECRSMLMPSNQNFAAILPGGDSLAGTVVTNGILNFLNIYNTLLVIRLVLTWFPSAPPAIVSPLSTLCDPYLNIFRGIIPPLGGTLDLSPIIAFLVLNAFTSTAAALPAELPPAEALKDGASLHSRQSLLTSSQKKWFRRLVRDKSNKPGAEI